MRQSQSQFKREPIEVINSNFPRGDFHCAIFDFDGTLSLLRRNWQDVMIPMMVDALVETGTTESRQQLHELVREFVTRLTGRQTIYQMIQLAEEVTRRGVQPKDPLDYKRQYHDRLWAQVESRVESVRSEEANAESMMVPNSNAFLSALLDQGVNLYLASGTDLTYVRDEVNVLGLNRYFESRVYGAIDDYKNFSKAMVIEKIVADTGVAGSQMIGIGDGFVEIEEMKQVGGLTIGVASDEVNRGAIDRWKRSRLIEAGADLIIADYQPLDELLNVIGLA